MMKKQNPESILTMKHAYIKLRCLFAGAALAAVCAAGVRPYEMEWAGRTKDDRPALMPLVSADGWTCVATNGEATVSTARERVLFGDGVMHLAYRLDPSGGNVRITPPAPVPTPPGFDTVSVWLYGNHTCFYRNGQARPILSAEFKDANGRPFSIDLHVFNHSEWFFVQKRLPEKIIERMAKGGTFTGFTLRGKHDEKKRWIEITSFATFKEELKPLSFKPRRKRGVQVFPNEPQGLNTGEGLLPFPNVETTIIPIVAEDPDIEFKLPKDPTKLDDLAVRWRKGKWFYFAKGGGLFPAAAAKGAKVRFHRIANSLIADIEAPEGVEEVTFGRLESTNGTKFVSLPYYTCGGQGDGIYRRPCVVMAGEDDNRFFFLASADWTQSNASWMVAPNYPPSRPPVASNGGVRYYPKTDGKRNPVFERFVWSFSRKFDDVMPVIPNPPSPYRTVTAERQWRVMYSSDREKNKAWWRNRHRRGIRHLIVNDHEVCMRDGNESFTFRTRPAPKKGGDEGMRDFTRFMIDELGYMYGPYNNYTDFAPVNGWWSVDRVARARDGNLQRAWNRCYAPKPAFVNEACEVIWTELQRKFNFNTVYCDVHTCTTPWQRTDYDARVPGAGTFAATFYSYGEILDFERKVLGGPVYSEGQSHFMYCGLVDGNYGQDQKARLPVEPWLVDFDLLRMHPLSNNFGMGSPQMFYEQGGVPTNAVERRDRFLAATIAFGHQGFFLTDNVENEEQSYFMLLGTGRHYCKADAKEIRYANAEGNLLDTTDAVVSDAYRRSQVVVRYTDGTLTAANGSTNKAMNVMIDGRRIVLPPNGYLARAGDGSACVVSGAAWQGGGRLDISIAPDYVYFNAYGEKADTPFGGTDGRMYRMIGTNGTDEVFLCAGTAFTLPYVAEAVIALGEDGKEIGPATFKIVNGRTQLTQQKGAFSFRVKKPASWREPKSDAAFTGFAEMLRGVTKAEYLDLVEASVAAYSDAHIRDYITEVESGGVQEHGFPRLTSNLGGLIAAGRQRERINLFRRMMDISCREAKKGAMSHVGGGNDFSVKELVGAIVDLERAGVFPKDVTDGWRRDISEVDPWQCYRAKPKVGNQKRSYNWAIFGTASEQTRLNAGMGGNPRFVEKYVSDQIRWFDENGQWRDPHEPLVYDFVTRLQFAQVLSAGYDGPSRAALVEHLDRGAAATLALQSVCGEIPYGGRSNQFLHNDTFYAALCEWYAARFRERGNLAMAARFRAAAARAVAGLRRWLAERPVRHVKNLYATGSGKPGTGIGCESYAYFDKYMATMGSWAMMAMRFADYAPLPEAPEDDISIFASSPYFHIVALRAGEYSAQFDYNADSNYDCDGLGRIHRRGAPTAICLSVPCAKKPAYHTERQNKRALAIAPVGGGKLAPAGSGRDKDGAWANWKKGALDWRCRLAKDGLHSELLGEGDVALSLPAFEFDGKNKTKISLDGNTLVIRYRGWQCIYKTDGEIVDTGTSCCNRNGRYGAFEALGKGRLSVKVSIEKSDRPSNHQTIKLSNHPCHDM